MNDPLATAVVTNAGYIQKIADAIGIGARLAPYTGKITAQVTELDSKLIQSTGNDPAPAVVPDTSWFNPSDNLDEVYIVGGSPANPNGCSWSFGDAIAWFTYVLSHGIGYHSVRPTLLPGSKVLSPSGLAAVQAFENGPNLTEAPEDFNPLGLVVVP